MVGNKKMALSYSMLLVTMLGGAPTLNAKDSNLTPPVVGHMPIASDVKVTPSAPKATGVVSVMWNYSDSDADAQKDTKIEWLVDDAPVHEILVDSSPTTGGAFSLPADAIGKTLKIRVTPNSAPTASPTAGAVVTTAGALIYSADTNFPPVASDVLFGPANPVAGQAVTVSWAYSDADDDAQQGSTIEWLLNGAVVHTTTANSSPSPAYTLGNVQGQTLTVRVTPKTNVGVAEGAPVASLGVVTLGRAPVFTSDITLGGAAIGGGTLTVSDSGNVYGYSDADGDAPGTHRVEWYKNGSITSSTGKNYGGGRGGSTVFARVYPTSSASVNPKEGAYRQSNTVTMVPYIDFWLKPLPTHRTWSAADNFCKSQDGGWRLPTRAELERLYTDTTGYALGTSVPQASDFCSKHGWPMLNRCGGWIDTYWTGDVTGSGHYAISLLDGRAFVGNNTSTRQVACIR